VRPVLDPAPAPLVFSAAVLFSIVALAALPVDPADRAPVWVAREVPPAVVPCIPPALPPVDLQGPAVAPWVRAPASVPVQDLASAPVWVAQDSRRRLLARLRVRHVPDRVAVAVRVTRKPKKVP